MITHPFNKVVNVPQLSEELKAVLGDSFIGITTNDSGKFVHLADNVNLAQVDAVIEAHVPGEEALVVSESERLTALENALVAHLTGGDISAWADMMLSMGRITSQVHTQITA